MSSDYKISLKTPSMDKSFEFWYNPIKEFIDDVDLYFVNSDDNSYISIASTNLAKLAGDRAILEKRINGYKTSLTEIESRIKLATTKEVYECIKEEIDDCQSLIAVCSETLEGFDRFVDYIQFCALYICDQYELDNLEITILKY